MKIRLPEEFPCRNIRPSEEIKKKEKANESCGLANQTFSDRNDKKYKHIYCLRILANKEKLSFVF